ncbi:hypothetical protein [Psychroflexus tropicus]|uniref:hypothetical protein n=1 Tax=Psychroflexus tropicus TaxID=197345 RepID=UPI0003A39552|nr:hypothetical protein [Psychroflexus tropicus]
MDEAYKLINETANFTSAGTSQLSVKTSKGVEQVSVENLSRLDEDFEHSDLGRLYSEFPENFAKIQKISFRDKHFYNCYFSSNEEMIILKFDEVGLLMGDDSSISNL